MARYYYYCRYYYTITLCNYYRQIWHDNSGGGSAGWYLGKVVFIDLQRKRWLVVYYMIYITE